VARTTDSGPDPSSHGVADAGRLPNPSARPAVTVQKPDSPATDSRALRDAAFPPAPHPATPRSSARTSQTPAPAQNQGLHGPPRPGHPSPRHLPRRPRPPARPPATSGQPHLLAWRTGCLIPPGVPARNPFTVSSRAGGRPGRTGLAADSGPVSGPRARAQRPANPFVCRPHVLGFWAGLGQALAWRPATAAKATASSRAPSSCSWLQSAAAGV
jgi:hypothetical protein